MRHRWLCLIVVTQHDIATRAGERSRKKRSGAVSGLNLALKIRSTLRLHIVRSLKTVRFFDRCVIKKGEIPSPNALSTCEILSPSVSWCLNMLGTLDIKLIICTFVITVGMLYNVCFGFFFCTQFGKQFVGLHFVFLGAHGSAVSLPLSPAGTFSCTCICYVWVIIGFTLCFV